MARTCFLITFWLLSHLLAGQPPQVYFGGAADGHSISDVLSDSSIYVSSGADGFTISLYAASGSLFVGGPDDGYNSGHYNQPGSIYRSLYGDGFAVRIIPNPGSIFNGSAGDGFALNDHENPGTMYASSIADGFSVSDYLFYHTWTGLIGTGWNVAGNWTDNIIPDENIRVRIPPGVPNFPFVNIGTFTIGSGTGTYLCKALLIEPGGQLTTRINAVTEIYSKVEVKGLMIVKNQTPNTFQVLGGDVIVFSGGELRITND